ncbi:MAG TPA: hypothetical protein VJC10_01365 [Patescibacteria group bacterium]|nr:hypothetical protein [Patescibacteria group bacterium]
MNHLPLDDILVKMNPHSLRIWDEVVGTMEKYTCDSYIPTFLQPETIISECRSMAVAFTLLHYNPLPENEEVYRSKMYSLFFFSSVCGVQIYLKEYSFFNNFAPYSIEGDSRLIRESKNRALRQLTEGIEISETINQIMTLFLIQLDPIKEKLRRRQQDESVNQHLFEKLLPITMVWGYLFAQEVTRELS